MIHFNWDAAKAFINGALILLWMGESALGNKVKQVRHLNKRASHKFTAAAFRCNYSRYSSCNCSETHAH